MTVVGNEWSQVGFYVTEGSRVSFVPLNVTWYVVNIEIESFTTAVIILNPSQPRLFSKRDRPVAPSAGRRPHVLLLVR